MRSFLDTDILVYADAGDEAIKQRRALALISEHRLAGSAVISAQVLQEYTNVALRKLGLPVALVRERLSFYARFEVVTTTSALIADAFDLHVLRGVAFYDAMIVQAAIAGGCARLLSEDMQDGAVLSGVRICRSVQGLIARLSTRRRLRRLPQSRFPYLGSIYADRRRLW